MTMEPGFEVSLEPGVRPLKQQENKMFPASRSLQRFLLVTVCLLFLDSPAMAQEAKSIITLRDGKGVDAPRIKRVLILHSFGRDFAPFNALSSSFRTALAEQSATPIEFFEASLESTLFAEDGSEAFLVDYLRARFANRPADLVVPIGAPGLMFLQRHRDKLFPGAPILVVGADKRRMSNLRSDANATAVGINFDFPGIIQNILQIFPSTTRIEVVTGNSPFEKFWMTEYRRDVQPFTDRVRFEWLNELSFEAVRRRSATLPRDSVILYCLLVLDAAAVPHEQDHALDMLRNDSNAPIFGIFDSQLGRGIVGGPLYPYQEVSRVAARLALQILNGSPAGSIEPVFVGPETAYDWRELTRWKIRENQLPPGSIVRFRQPGLWEQYYWYIVGALAIMTVQAVFIVGLILQRARRRRAEEEQRTKEQALRFSEARYRAVVEDQTELICRFLPDGTYTFVNDAYCRYFQRSREELLGYSFWSFIPPEGHGAAREFLASITPERPIATREHEVLAPDGDLRWQQWRDRGFFDDQGRVVDYQAVGRDITERKHAEQMLRENETALRASYDRIQDLAGRLITAQEAERSRIASDLHDDVNQQLAGLSIALSNVKQQLQNGGDVTVQDELTRLQQRTVDLADVIRNLSHELHPGVLQHAGLAAALKGHCAEVGRQYPIEVTFSAVDGLDGIPHDVALCLYRVAQEALRNVAAHAGARKAQVTLRSTDDGLELVIADDGQGFNLAEARHQEGLGLISLDERVRLVGGSLTIDTEPKRGTEVRVQVPLGGTQ